MNNYAEQEYYCVNKIKNIYVPMLFYAISNVHVWHIKKVMYFHQILSAKVT